MNSILEYLIHFSLKDLIGELDETKNCQAGELGDHKALQQPLALVSRAKTWS
jgi:hypothetical protein